jgi:hypothetical protein
MSTAPDIAAGLKHLGSGVTTERFQRVTDIIPRRFAAKEYRQVMAPLGSLASCYNALALQAGAGHHDLLAMRHYAGLQGRTLRTMIQLEPLGWGNGIELLYPLLSDDEALLHWRSQYMASHFGAVNGQPSGLQPTRYSYLSIQPHLALQQDWANLTERSERWLATEQKENKSYAVDQRFYLALAKGDSVAMEQALFELLGGKIARHRNREFGLGAEQRLVSAWGLILAKLAYRAGYPLHIDHPWLPQDWLPIEPLADYRPELAFLRRNDLFAPLPALKTDWCEDYSRYSPRPMGETPLSFDSIREMIAQEPYYQKK